MASMGSVVIPVDKLFKGCEVLPVFLVFLEPSFNLAIRLRVIVILHRMCLMFSDLRYCSKECLHCRFYPSRQHRFLMGCASALTLTLHIFNS